MDVSAPATPLIMDPFGAKTQDANAFEFDFISGGNFFNTEEDDLLSSLYNKNQPQTTNTDILFDNENTFTSLSHIVNEKSLPDSPDSWVSNSSNSDNECEDLELCEFTSETNVQKTTAAATHKTKQQQPPVMSGALPTSFLPQNMNYPYQQGMMDPSYLGGMMPMPMMSPQQLMFLQQQQQAFSTFNAMGYANFVPAPVPQKPSTNNGGKKSTSPTASSVKQERASPKTAAHPTKKSTPNNNTNNTTTTTSTMNNTNLKRRRDVSPPKEDSPTVIVETNSNHSSPTSSPSSSPTPKPEKDVKRQRRLIKNRESAQASRERKKVYVQGLEKRVDDLAQTNNALNTKVLTLEEENNLLREKLLSMDTDGSLMKELNEPSFKKRRIGAQQQPKIPIPSLQQQSMNPFANGFWNAFMSFAPPHAQNTNASAWNTGTQSKKVVLFVMLFCVAVLVMSSKKGEEGNLPVTSTIQGDGVQIIVPNLERRNMGRKIFGKQEVNLFQQYAEQFLEIQHNTTKMDVEMDVKEEEEEEKSTKSGLDYQLEYSKDKNSLVLTFPLSVVKQEPEIGQCGTSANQQMENLTRNLLSTLCKELN